MRKFLQEAAPASGRRQAKACRTKAGRRLACVLVLASVAVAQPGQLLGPPQQSKMQDGNLKPALPGALQGVGIDQRLDQQVSLDLMFKDEAGRDVRSPHFSNAASR